MPRPTEGRPKAGGRAAGVAVALMEAGMELENLGGPLDPQRELTVTHWTQNPNEITMARSPDVQRHAIRHRDTITLYRTARLGAEVTLQHHERMAEWKRMDSVMHTTNIGRSTELIPDPRLDIKANYPRKHYDAAHADKL